MYRNFARNFLQKTKILISLQPDSINFSNCKLIIFDLTVFNILGLKYQRSTTSGCRDIEIKKLEFVAKSHFLRCLFFCIYNIFPFQTFDFQIILRKSVILAKGNDKFYEIGLYNVLLVFSFLNKQTAKFVLKWWNIFLFSGTLKSQLQDMNEMFIWNFLEFSLRCIEAWES